MDQNREDYRIKKLRTSLRGESSDLGHAGDNLSDPASAIASAGALLNQVMGDMISLDDDSNSDESMPPNDQSHSPPMEAGCSWYEDFEPEQAFAGAPQFGPARRSETDEIECFSDSDSDVSQMFEFFHLSLVKWLNMILMVADSLKSLEAIQTIFRTPIHFKMHLFSA